MRWPWQRKPEPPKPLGPINEDWAAGDKAQCVEDFGTRPAWMGIDLPRRGTVYIVNKVVQGHHMEDGTPAWGLFLEKMNGCYDADYFRKLRPSEDVEFLAKIKAIKRPRVKEDA